MVAGNERANPAPPPILVIGMSAGGADSLPVKLVGRIATADLLVGGRRHLDYFSDFQGDSLPVGAKMNPVIERLDQAQKNRERAVVLASGDPLYYGIGATLRRHFPAEALEIIPAPTAFQLAFAALAEPWSDAALLSAHARPLADVVAKLVLPGSQRVGEPRLEQSEATGGFSPSMLTAPKAAILTDNRHTPTAIAKALLQAGLIPETTCAICENLGSTAQRVVQTTLAEVDTQEYAPLNVFVVWNKWQGQPQEGAPNRHIERKQSRIHSPGLVDDVFSTSGGQITKREVRLLSLANLALRPESVVWDIGAGSGAVAIEAARSQPTATVFAIEKRAEMCHHVRENLRRFPAPNVRLTAGTAPEDMAGWPDPDAVFIGGSGNRLAEIIDLVKQKLQVDGHLVVNLATLENLSIVRSLMPDARVTQVQINHGVPILDMMRFDALNPVFIVTWEKTGG